MAAVVNYSPPWWANLLHRLPHFNLQFEQISGEFRPEDSEYQESLLLLGAVALACLALDLLFLLFYSFWLCCRRRKSEEPANADCCCTAWCVIIATLVCRWLGYLSLLLFDVLICLLVLFGLIRNSKGTLIGVCFLGVLTLIISWASLGLELAISAGSSDFCVSPNIYISKVAEENDVISKDILQYYLKCDTGHPNPFQQKLSGSHKALVEMQDDVAELLRSAIREYPQTKGTLEQIQGVLNSTEISLHQLTALVDCRSLHMDYVQALTGLCYDGVEGLIYLVLFSFVTALMFSSIVCSVPHTWQHKRSEEDGEEESMAQGNRQTHDNLYRVHMPSLYSCGSSYGSETSIPAAAHTVSNAPVTEYILGIQLGGPYFLTVSLDQGIVKRVTAVCPGDDHLFTEAVEDGAQLP
ncbi:UNVERIFIED_CONTAM: hypothetical protein FKN15_003108 [Acipenser sinensis]